VSRKNEWLQARDKDLTVEELMDATRGQFRWLADFVAETSVEDLNNPFRFPSLQGKSLASSIMSGSFFSHARGEHGADFAEWREKGAKGATSIQSGRFKIDSTPD
jgi:hypothetical protein